MSQTLGLVTNPEGWQPTPRLCLGICYLPSGFGDRSQHQRHTSSMRLILIHIVIPSIHSLRKFVNGWNSDMVEYQPQLQLVYSFIPLRKPTILFDVKSIFEGVLGMLILRYNAFPK